MPQVKLQGQRRHQQKGQGREQGQPVRGPHGNHIKHSFERGENERAGNQARDVGIEHNEDAPLQLHLVRVHETVDAAVIPALNPRSFAIHPINTGAVPPPPSQPTELRKPAAVPRASGRTTSNSEAKMFASYMPLQNPHSVSATMSEVTDRVMPHHATNGAPHKTPVACTRMRPRGVFVRRKSASHPPVREPRTLAAWTKNVAVNPATASPM